MSLDEKQIYIGDDSDGTCCTLRTFLDVQKLWINEIMDVSRQEQEVNRPA